VVVVWPVVEDEVLVLVVPVFVVVPVPVVVPVVEVAEVVIGR
jgi:hypothetical protein